MKKKFLHLISLLSIVVAIQVVPVFGQLPAGCAPFIRQKDTTICSGASVLLDLLAAPPKDTLLPGVWKLLIKGSSIDTNLFNIKPFGYDKVKQYLYSIIHKKIIRFDLKNNSISSVPANNWPDDYTEFTYDYTNKRLLCWRGGRDSIYAIPDIGGNWTTIGVGAIDRESYGSSVYWNPTKQQAGVYGGYGFNQVKSWIYENDGNGWQQRKTNPLVDSTPPKGGNIVSSNADGTKLYLFSGQGSYTGNELAGTCTLGSPWATANGMFCWLRDLWELDLATYTFKNILPVNNQSIKYEGALASDYNTSRFFLFGGCQPTGDYTTNQNLINTDKTFFFRKNIDSGFVEFRGEGEVPPAMPRTLLNNYAYYDPIGKRMIWARYDGIWAYYPDSTTVPPAFRSTVWSTGDTTASITVKPTQTTVYRVTRSIGSSVCKDSIRITVNNMQTALQPNTSVCGDSTLLDAGAGFNTYVWNTGAITRALLVTQNGTYTVSVSKGVCTAKDSSRVLLVTPIKDFSVGVLKDSVCTGDSDSLFVTNPQPGITYSWTVSGNPVIVNTGNYYLVNNIGKDVSYVINAASNPAICASKNATAKIIVRTKLPTPIIYTDSVGLTTVLFRWDAVAGATGYLVSLDGGNTFINPSGGPQGLTQLISGLVPNQTIGIIVKATGAYGCQTSNTVQVKATTLNPFGNGIYAPNAFTPNGDGVNDVFLIYGTAIASIRLLIYNQWGSMVFMSSDISKGWDGVYKGAKAPASMYTYALEAIMQDGKKVTKNGSFSLIR